MPSTVIQVTVRFKIITVRNLAFTILPFTEVIFSEVHVSTK